MTQSEPNSKPPKATRTGPVLALCLVVAVVGILGALYGMRAANRNGEVAAGADCAPAAALSKRIAPLAKGEVAGVQIASTPKPAVELSFVSPDGKPMKLSSLRGKTVLLNLWATWCAPCRQEMPALDALQSTLGSQDFEVVSINIDTQRLERPKLFLAEINVKNLAYYSDATANVFTDLKKAGKAFGMPTTLLIDRNGCELGSLAGPAEWSSEDAKALVKAALKL